MKRQKLEIGHPLQIEVTWYDKVRGVPPVTQAYDGEVLAWGNSQVTVRVPHYGVLKFWKTTGIEVGNADHIRRGFRIDLNGLAESVKPAPGVDIELGDT